MHPLRPRRTARPRADLLLWAGLLSISASALLPGVGASSQPAPREAFLRWFWDRPLADQGRLDSVAGASGDTLAPTTCGSCHKDQFDDWAGSRHAQAMGAGVLGQLLGQPSDWAQECLNCHAPLQEQAASLQIETAEPGHPRPNEGHGEASDALHEQGVICAACHVRRGLWYGPPRRADQPPPDANAVLPHDGWIAMPAFEDPRFCAACHQFPDDGYALNGKLLENTYEEWKASPQAQAGLTCQGCHMPDRRHLWRGIHDPETVRSGVSIRVDRSSLKADRLEVRLLLSNTGTGHLFPTYVTPEVTLEIYQEDAEGSRIPGTSRQAVIARDVSLDLTVEYSDTRLAPGETFSLGYQLRPAPRASGLVARVRVEPDAFYSRFFQALLDDELDAEARLLIGQALRETSDSGFVLFEERYDISARAP